LNNISSQYKWIQHSIWNYSINESATTIQKNACLKVVEISSSNWDEKSISLYTSSVAFGKFNIYCFLYQRSSFKLPNIRRVILLYN